MFLSYPYWCGCCQLSLEIKLLMLTKQEKFDGVSDVLNSQTVTNGGVSVGVYVHTLFCQIVSPSSTEAATCGTTVNKKSQ